MAVIDLLCTLVGTLDPHEWWESPSYLDSSTPSLRGLWQKRNLSFSSGRRGSCTCDGTMKIDIDTKIQRICYTVSFIDLNSGRKLGKLPELAGTPYATCLFAPCPPTSYLANAPFLTIVLTLQLCEFLASEFSGPITYIDFATQPFPSMLNSRRALSTVLARPTWVLRLWFS